MTFPEELKTWAKMHVIKYPVTRITAGTSFSQQFRDRLTLTRFEDVVRKELLFHLSGAIATWKKERVLQVPATWWDHLKEAHASSWFLGRWPVRHTNYDANVFLPEVPVANPKYHTVEFAVWKEEEL